MEDDHNGAAILERLERRDSRENRQLLLDVAKRLFAEQGVAATSMKDIAQAAGVGKGTLYRHFAHKGELCGALLHEDVAAFQERVGALICTAGGEASPLTRLEVLIAELIRMMELHLPLFAAIEEAVVGTPQERPFRGPFGTWLHTQMVGLLEEAVAQGEVGLLDHAFTTDAMLAAVAPALYRYQRHVCGYSMERIMMGMRRLFIDGLRQDLARQPPRPASLQGEA